jgi:hypothetical protein
MPYDSGCNGGYKRLLKLTMQDTLLLIDSSLVAWDSRVRLPHTAAACPYAADEAALLAGALPPGALRCFGPMRIRTAGSSWT